MRGEIGERVVVSSAAVAVEIRDAEDGVVVCRRRPKEGEWEHPRAEAGLLVRVLE